MQKLWAPWRIEYVLQEEPEDCIFCTKSSRDVDDRKELVLSRGTCSFVIMNLYPYNNGHIMVSPYQHSSDYEEIDTETHHEMITFQKRWIRVLKAAIDPDGFNIGANLGRVAGAGVEDHYHVHIVPRWSGDTNFMPILGHTKILVEGLEETWERLVNYYEQLYGDRNKSD